MCYGMSCEWENRRGHSDQIGSCTKPFEVPCPGWERENNPDEEELMSSYTTIHRFYDNMSREDYIAVMRHNFNRSEADLAEAGLAIVPCLCGKDHCIGWKLANIEHDPRFITI